MFSRKLRTYLHLIMCFRKLRTYLHLKRRKRSLNDLAETIRLNEATKRMIKIGKKMEKYMKPKNKFSKQKTKLLLQRYRKLNQRLLASFNNSRRARRHLGITHYVTNVTTVVEVVMNDKIGKKYEYDKYKYTSKIAHTGWSKNIHFVC